MSPDPLLDPILARLERRFDWLRAKLVVEHEGQWALLFDRGRRLVPELHILDDEWDAIRSGYADPDLRRFCVKQVASVDEPVFA